MLSCLDSKSAPKLERKYVERNRRNNLKYLYKQLHSRLPTYNPKETVPVPDQLDAALKYIESLKLNLEKNKKHLEELKRAQSSNQTNELGSTKESPPKIELIFHEMGPNMVMVLITGLNNITVFNNIVRLCHKEGVEVVASHFELNGNSTFQISLETEVTDVSLGNSFGQKYKINGSSSMECRSSTLCDKIKELIYGPSYENNHEESQLNCLWDYIIEYDALELLPTPSQNLDMPSHYMQNVNEMIYY